MKKTTCILLFISSVLYAHAQQMGCDGNRYFNTVFDNVTVTANIKYGQNITLAGATIDLLMDIYEPTGDLLDKRPVIVFAHGGGFASGAKEDMGYICKDFARRGFVTASISYRLLDVPLSDPSVMQKEVIMAIMDMKAAIRFFREDAATADIYKVDPDFIFAGGASAGAIMANNLAYIDSLDTIAPALLAIINSFGGLEGNSSSNTQYSSAVQGVLNYSGAIADIDFIDADDPPLYSFHDEFDKVVPCGYDPLVLPFYGSCSMDARAEAVGLKHQFYLHGESDGHVSWYYATVLYESAQFLGSIVCTNAPASPWEETGSGLNAPGFPAFDISVVDENIIWVVPFLGKQFSKTTDGGQTWTTGTIPVSNPDQVLVGIQAMNENLAWAMVLAFPGQLSGKMYKTTDGGLSWTEQSTAFINPNEGPQVFHFFNENDGFALGLLSNQSYPYLSSHVGYITSDGGATWAKLDASVYPATPGEKIFTYDTKFLGYKGDHLWFGTSTGKMYHSSDRGHTWEVHDVAPGIAIQSVAFKDESNGIAVAGNDSFGNHTTKAFATSDGGLTWTELTVPSLPRTTGVYFVEGSAEEANSCGAYIIFNGFDAASGASLSTDGGQSWELISQQPVFDIEFLNSETGWMGGMIHGAEAGGLYKWAGPSLMGNSDCVSSATENPADNSDLLIYPNPTTDIAQIEWENDWRGDITLRLVNVLGQSVFFESYSKNTHPWKGQIELSDLPPGIYHILLSDGKKRRVGSVVRQ